MVANTSSAGYSGPFPRTAAALVDLQALKAGLAEEGGGGREQLHRRPSKGRMAKTFWDSLSEGWDSLRELLANAIIAVC